MSFSQRDQTILSDLGKAHVIHQDLKELLDFYGSLFRAQFAFKSQLGVSGKAVDLAREEVNLTGLTDGLPQMTFKELNMQATPFMDLYKSVVQLLIPYAGESDGLETDPSPEKDYRMGAGDLSQQRPVGYFRSHGRLGSGSQRICFGSLSAVGM